LIDELVHAMKVSTGILYAQPCLCIVKTAISRTLVDSDASGEGDIDTSPSAASSHSLYDSPLPPLLAGNVICRFSC